MMLSLLKSALVMGGNEAPFSTLALVMGGNDALPPT